MMKRTQNDDVRTRQEQICATSSPYKLTGLQRCLRQQALTTEVTNKQPSPSSNSALDAQGTCSVQMVETASKNGQPKQAILVWRASRNSTTRKAAKAAWRN